MKHFFFRIFRGLVYRLKSIFHGIKFYYKRLFKFILPNLFKIVQKKIIFDKYPICNQKVIASGLGIVLIGNDCVFGYKLGGNFYKGLIEIQPRYSLAKIIIGNNVSTNNNMMLCAANFIEIGDDTLIGQNVTIMDHEAHGTAPENRKKLGEIGKVIIGRNVWIGNNVTILKNSVIGENSIVATGAVVSGEYPANVIIGGIPAKIIKNINV